MATGSSPRAIAAAGDTRLTAVVNNGLVLQSTRSAAGAWSAFTQVQNVPGSAISADEVVIAGQRNLVVLTTTGLYHSVQSANGSWGAFTDVVGLGAGLPDIEFTIGSGGRVGRVSVANAGGVLHIVLTGIGQATHTYRNANGAWAPFSQGSLIQQRGYIRNAEGVGLPSGQLHVAVTTIIGSGTVYHAIRSGDGAWTNLAAVPGPGRTINLGFVAAAAIGDQVHLVVADAGFRRLYHAIRFADGSWTGFTDVTDQTGVPRGGPVTAVGDANGQLQIAVAAYPAAGLFHAVRLASGQWTPFVDVKALAGDPGPVDWPGISAE